MLVFILQSYLILDLGPTTETYSPASLVVTEPSRFQHNFSQTNSVINRIPNLDVAAHSDNSANLTVQGKTAVVKSTEAIYRNAINLKKIFSGQIKSRPHVRREDLQASQIVMDSAIYKKNNVLSQHLENDQEAKVQDDTNIKSALIHGPLGANARDLILNRALKVFKKELSKDHQNPKSNIVIFCSNDIACDDMARRMLKLMPKSKDRLEVLSAMRVIRDDHTFNQYQKLETGDLEANKPKIFFVNAHSIKAKIKKDDAFDKTSTTLSKLTKILNLPELKYLYFTQAHELSTSVNDNLFDYLMRTINPLTQKTTAAENKKENQPLELLGSTYYKPQRGSDAASSINLEDYFSNTTIYIPSPNQLIVSGQMPSLDEHKTLRHSTKIGEKTAGANEKLRAIDLKIDYLHDQNFLNEIVDEYINSFHSKKARNIISLERDEKTLEKLTEVLKTKKIAFGVLTSEGLRRFDSEANEHTDFKSRIEILDRLGKDYSLLVHYDEALLSGLEIPVDNQLLLCLPDISDDKTEAAISSIRTPYGEEERGLRPNQRGLLFLERSSHVDKKHYRKTIAELITDIEKRHDDGKASQGRFIANDHHHSNGKSTNTSPINQNSGTTNKISIKVEDEEWFKFLGRILGIKNTDDYDSFAQKVEDEIDGYAEMILDQVGLEQDDLNTIRVAKILKGKEPYDKLKRDVIKAFINDKQRFIEAAVEFPHIVGIETFDEAIEKIKFEIKKANLETEFNGKWLAELNKVSNNAALSLVGTFLLEKGDHYGKPLCDDELLHSALRVIFAGQENYNGSTENAKELFLDFYNYVNQKYGLAALKVNQILTETAIGKDLKIDFNSSLNLNRPNDLYNNILVLLEDQSLFKNAKWLGLLDGSLGLHTSERNTFRARFISDYIQQSALAIGFIANEELLKNLITTLLGNHPQRIDSQQAKNIFNDFANFLNSKKTSVNKLSPATIQDAAPTLFDPIQQINNLDSAKAYVLSVADHAKPRIDPSPNWASLVASCTPNGTDSRLRSIDLITEFLFEKQRNLITGSNEKNLKKAITLLACYNGSHSSPGEQSTTLFSEFCDWLNLKNPNLNPLQIHRQSANSPLYQPANRITSPQQACAAINYVITEAKPKSNIEWLAYLDQLEAGKNHQDIFAEYLLALRTAQANPSEAFKSFDDLKSALSTISGNGHSHNGKVHIDQSGRLKDFINYLNNKYGEIFDIIQVRSWFPEEIEFKETTKTKILVEKTILNTLNKIFPKVETYPGFLKKLFGTESTNHKLSEFMVNFLIPKYQEQINQIHNESDLSKLLHSMFGLSKITIQSHEKTLVKEFINHLIQHNAFDISEARSLFPESVSFQETVSTKALLEKTLALTLQNIFPGTKAYPEFLKTIFKSETDNHKLTEFIVNFLTPQHQNQIEQITDEKGLESLLRSMFGLNKNIQNTYERDLTQSFVNQLFQQTELTDLVLYPHYPSFIDLAHTETTKTNKTNQLENFTKIIELLISNNKAKLEGNILWLDKLDLAINNGYPLIASQQKITYKLTARSCIIANLLITKHPEYLVNDKELLVAIEILLGSKTAIDSNPDLAAKLIDNLNQYFRDSNNPKHAEINHTTLAQIFPNLFKITKEIILKTLRDNYLDLLKLDLERIQRRNFDQAAVIGINTLNPKPLSLGLIDFIKSESGFTLQEAAKFLDIKLIEHNFHQQAYKDFLTEEFKKDGVPLSHVQNWMDTIEVPINIYQFKLALMKMLLNDAKDETYLDNLNKRLQLPNRLKVFCEFYLDQIICFSCKEGKSIGTKNVYKIKTDGYELVSENVNTEMPAYTSKLPFK